jgi:hypothetical protein
MAEEEVNGKTQFEPPPWEREAFDALAARRAEEQAAREALSAAESASASPVQEPDPWAGIRAEASGQVPAGAAVLEIAPEGIPAAAPAAKVDDRAVEAMLLQLQSEERTDGRAARWVGRVASALTFALGLGMLIAGLLMVRSGGGTSVALLGSAVLSIFGLSFMGMAVWVWITTNRSRGR